MFGIAAGGALQNEPVPTLQRDLTDDHDAGARWVRVDINWAQIQAAGPRAYDWYSLDRVVTRARRLDMRVLGTIIYTPAWARPAGSNPTWGPRPAAYARFALATARPFSGRVQALEIWNEENTKAFWSPRPSTANYTALLRAAYRAVKSVAPRDTVITGGTAPASENPGEISPVRFLEGIYAHRGKGSFDAVGDHPYCWPFYPGAPDASSAWYQMYGTTPSLRSVMVIHGDGAKNIWATECGAPTGGPRGDYVSEATQARMIARAYERFSSYRWAGPLFLYQGRDAGRSRSTVEDWFGFIFHDFRPKPAFRVYRRLAETL